MVVLSLASNTGCGVVLVMEVNVDVRVKAGLYSKEDGDGRKT